MAAGTAEPNRTCSASGAQEFRVGQTGEVRLARRERVAAQIGQAGAAARQTRHG
jgi:hypothetical protein